MFQISKRQLAISFLIVVFTLGIVSPACAKLWDGEQMSVLEICTSKGIQKIAVNGEELPSGGQSSDKDGCTFCQTYNAALTSVDINFVLENVKYQLPEITAQDRLIAGLTTTKPYTTGPPSILLS